MLVLVAALALGGAVLALGPHGKSHSATAAGPAPTATAADFAILGRGHTPRDDLPAAVEHAVFGTNNPAPKGVSRTIDTPTGRGWVVPLSGKLCVIVPDPVDGYGVMCAPTETARESGVFGVLASDDTSRLTLVLPRGASASARRSDGSRAPLPSDADGVVNATLQGGSSITVTAPDGTTVDRRLPVPPPVVAPPTAPGSGGPSVG